MRTKLFIASIFISAFVLSSCESKTAKQQRLANVERERTQREQQKEEERVEQEKEAEIYRIEREAQLEKERKEQAIYDQYINNSLHTGATPYSRYYGANSTCLTNNCSQIKVKTSNSDVLVTIKRDDEVVRHAYIKAGSTYTFSFPNGNYQAFFYYGRGWNPEKEMKNGTMKGGFITNEDFGKDSEQSLFNEVLTYELILQTNGNFSTRPSSPEEAL